MRGTARGEPTMGMDAVRVGSTQTGAAASLNKGDFPVTDEVGRALTEGGRELLHTRRQSPLSLLPSQHILPVSFGTSYDPEEPQLLLTSAGWGQEMPPPGPLGSAGRGAPAPPGEVVPLRDDKDRDEKGRTPGRTRPGGVREAPGEERTLCQGESR